MGNTYGWRIIGGLGLGFCMVALSLAQEPIATPVAQPGSLPAQGLQPVPPPAAGVPSPDQVLARGPVHEAFAEPVTGVPKASPIVPKAPPEPIEELPPDQKPAGDHVVWLPGYFSWDEERTDFIWVSGFWRAPPPGRQWTPGHWKQAEGGWQWAPGFWDVVATTPQAVQQVTYLPPPPAPIESAPSTPAPSPDYSYVPGCWVWRDGRYVWRPGCWVACRPNWVWVPAHFVWTPCGYVFVEGYWDYTLRDRGMLFAPVYVDASLYRRNGWVYTPTYVVQDQCLYGALFVRPGCSGYYFGDYFGPAHRGVYVAWCDYQVGYYRDPLFSYYSWHNRSDPGWSISIRATFVNTYAGRIAPPPRTLVQQNTIINKTVVNNTTIINNTTNVTNNTQVNNVRNTSMLTPLNKVDPATTKLQPISMAARQTQQQAAKQVVQTSAVRGQTEARMLAQGPAPTKPTDRPRTAQMNLPRAPSAPASSGPAAVHSASQTPAASTHSTQPANTAQPNSAAQHPANTSTTTHPTNTAQPGAKTTTPANHTTPQKKSPPPPARRNEHNGQSK